MTINCYHVSLVSYGNYSGVLIKNQNFSQTWKYKHYDLNAKTFNRIKTFDRVNEN